MNPKKLCSLGILDINLNLTLTQSQTEKYDFDIDNYNTVSDLKNLFYPLTSNDNEVDYFKHIFISSDNDLINTLLYINRSFKSKTFIEFIMPNKLDFSSNTAFIHNMLIEVCNMNYLFIIENRILDTSSNIKLIINIIDDETKESIQYKTFDLFEMNDLEIRINNEENNDYIDNHIFNLDYNFDKVDFFLIDLFLFKELFYKNKYDMEQFLYKVINNNKQIKIILVINKNCFTGYDFTSLIEKYKEIIELSDIIFCDKSEMNYFFRTYNNMKSFGTELFNKSNHQSKINNSNKSKTNTNSYNNGTNEPIKDLLMKKIPFNLIDKNENRGLDLMIFDNEKHRKNIPRITILSDNFHFITIYEQSGPHMEVETKEIFYFKLNEQKLDFFSKSGKKYYYIFIGGFLSRLIHNKSFRVCFYAGQLLLEKIYKNIIKKKNIFKIDDYNVLVPNEKRSVKKKILRMNEKIMEEQKLKEKGFVLDCTNLNECKIKVYNPLLDNNCASYLLKKNIFDHLKNHGFINKNGIVLKDPDKYEKTKSNVSQKKNNIKPLFFETTNFNNLKLPMIKNNNNIICQTAKRTKDNLILKDIIKEKEKKYYKTINNFYRLNNLKIKNNKNYNKNSNNNSKNKIKLNLGLLNENNKIDEYFGKIAKNINGKNKANRNFKNKYLLKNIKLNKIKDKINLTKNKKLPKYNVYSKYLFQLYSPDIRLMDDFLETKSKSNKQRKLKRVHSQI